MHHWSWTSWVTKQKLTCTKTNWGMSSFCIITFSLPYKVNRLTRSNLPELATPNKTWSFHAGCVLPNSAGSSPWNTSLKEINPWSVINGLPFHTTNSCTLPHRLQVPHCILRNFWFNSRATQFYWGGVATNSAANFLMWSFSFSVSSAGTSPPPILST